MVNEDRIEELIAAFCDACDTAAGCRECNADEPCKLIGGGVSPFEWDVELVKRFLEK